MKIVFMGTPKFSVPILEALNEKYEIVLVVSQPDKEKNRKKELLPTPVKAKALELGLEVFQPVKIKEEYEHIIKYEADILITAAYGQIIPQALLKTFKKCLNVHASLLPKYRGGAPIQRSIMNGDEYTGITIMEMVKKMDAGDIFVQERIPILPADNNETLFDKLSITGKELLLNNLDEIINGNIVGIKQKEDEVTYAWNINREEEKINFNKTSLEIFNQIRGLAIEPGAYVAINNEIIKVYASEIVIDNSDNKPGTILMVNKKLRVKTGDGALDLMLIKPSGKNIMKTTDFLNGQKMMKIGDIFE